MFHRARVIFRSPNSTLVSRNLKVTPRHVKDRGSYPPLDSLDSDIPEADARSVRMSRQRSEFGARSLFGPKRRLRMPL